MIESRSNPKVKTVLQLRKSSARRESGQFLIDGVKELRHAMSSGIRIAQLFASPHSKDASMEVAVRESGGEVFEVSPSIMERISYGQRQDEIVAVARTPDLGLGSLDLHRRSLILVLDRTEKPGNLGACMRTASACGVDAVVLTNPICEAMNPNAIRASRGHLFRVPLAICTPKELHEKTSELGLGLLAARVDGEHDLWSEDFTQGCVIVFGNEAKGLEAEWNELMDHSFQIPMANASDSLNLSNSAAVTLYEAVRQRRSK